MAATANNAAEGKKSPGLIRRGFNAILIPLLAVFTGLFVGGIMIAISDPVVIRSITTSPWWVVTETEIDPTIQIALETGLENHPPEVGVGDYVVFPRGNSVIFREIVPTEADIEDPDSQIDLERAMRAAPTLASGRAGIPLSFWDRPLFAFQAAWWAIRDAYRALFIGSFGSPTTIIEGWQLYAETGNSEALRQAMRPLVESIVGSIPYIFAGLAVALGFRAGVFNIGVEGQLFVGAAFAAYVGYSFTNLPPIIHLPFAILAGMLGGGLWGFIPGWLKAKTGAHEVINTIMMNFIAFSVVAWLLRGPMKRPGGTSGPVSPFVEPSAYLPTFFGPPLRLHAGLILAILVTFFVWWLLFKTTIGFELRTVGSNPNAAKYAGINVSRNIILAMTLSGILGGLAGANEVLGVNHFLAESFSPGYGFDSIALALLGNSHPFGVFAAALLFGTLRSGATSMQSLAQVPIDIVTTIQAMVIVFVAAPEIIRWIYRIKAPKDEEKTVFTRGWGA